MRLFVSRRFVLPSIPPFTPPFIPPSTPVCADLRARGDHLPLACLVGEGRDLLHLEVREGIDDLHLEISARGHILNLAVHLTMQRGKGTKQEETDTAAFE
jgi:hypothetical protein